MIKGIVSLRGTTRFYFFQTIFEWENAIHDKLGVPIIRINPLRKMYLQRKKMKDYSIHNDFEHDIYLAFVMNVKSAKIYIDYNCIPVFLDVFTDTAEELVNVTKECRVFFVCCYNMYLLLKKRYHCENVRFIPQSVSDLLEGRRKVEKTIDVVQFGRKNEKLHNWMLNYTEKNPDVEYIYQRFDYKKPSYFSTKRGNVGDIRTRDQFLNMLWRTKISLVSARGKDEKEGECGYDFVTPRIYESAVAGCQLIGRYTDNYESNYCDVFSVCEVPDSYDAFAEALTRKLKIDIDREQYIRFVNRNMSTTRLKEIEKILNGYISLNQ